MTKSRWKVDEAPKDVGALPWYVPKDLSNMGVRLHSQILHTISKPAYDVLMSARAKEKNGQAVRLRKREEQTLANSILAATAASPEFLARYAEESLLKPLEVMKMLVAQSPKEVKVEGTHHHAHVIVVPDRADPDVWNEAHTTRRELGDGDWGVTLEGTPFVEFVERSEDDTDKR